MAAEQSDREPEEELFSQQPHKYDNNEQHHNIALAIYQCVSCFTHTLQLVVHTYDNDVSSHLKGPISRVNKLVKKFNKLTLGYRNAHQKTIKKAHHCFPNLMELNISDDISAT